MLKVITGFIVGIILIALSAWKFGGDLMVVEHPSPFGVEETAARIQANIQSKDLADRGWALSALRDPSRAVAASGRNVPPVLLVEACSTAYSGPIIAEEGSRILSILMPCTITVYKKDDGKTYIGTMNTALMGQLFGAKVASIMQEVAKDQARMLEFDPSQPAPPLIRTQPGGGGGGGGPQAGSGC